MVRQMPLAQVMSKEISWMRRPVLQKSTAAERRRQNGGAHSERPNGKTSFSFKKPALSNEPLPLTAPGGVRWGVHV